MSALAHWIEASGIPTTGISLVREHTAAMKPPRFLWVPFPLGRPLGVPGDAAFQRRVILAALRLLEAEHGPVLADFPEDLPEIPDPTGTSVPIISSVTEDTADGDLPALVHQEIERLMPWYERAVRTRGRTTYGLSGLAPLAAGRFLSRFLDATLPTSYRDDLSLGEALKHAAEDLKAFYLEAAAAQTGPQSAASLASWFWHDTTAGGLLRRIQARGVQSADRSVRAIARSALVPRAHLL